MSKEYKCASKNCRHKDSPVDVDDCIKTNSAYWHKDCYKQKENLKMIIKLFSGYVNCSKKIYADLQRVCRDIVLNKGIDSELLLFGLKYYINHKITLNYPAGLYYIIQNKDVIEAYHRNKLKEQNVTFEITTESSPNFTHKPAKTKGFADILK